MHSICPFFTKKLQEALNATNIKFNFQHYERVNILAKSAPNWGDNFNSDKNRKEIQFQKKSKKLTMFMSFWHIFPVVFYEFLPYVSSYLSNLTFFYTISC